MEKVEIRTSSTRLKTIVMGNKVFRSCYDHDLSPEDVEIARSELNETDEVRTNSLRTLKQMLSQDGVKYRTDDAYLLRFLRCKKFKCDEAHKMIKHFYSVRKRYPEIYHGLHPDLEKMLNVNIITCVPYRDEDGSLLFIMKIDRWNPQTHSSYDIIQIGQPILDIFSMNPACQINKLVAIFDCKGFSMRHLSACLYPSSQMLIVNTIQNMHPWRIKYIIFVNCNSFVLTLLKVIRHLFKKKIADRLVCLGSDMEELHKYVSPTILTKEYGGNLEENDCSISQHIMDNLPYIEYEHSFCKA